MRRIVLFSLGLLILFSAQPDIQAADEEEHPDITPLIEALKYPDENFRVAVVRALRDVGEDALPLLIPLILDEYNKVQLETIYCIRKFGRKAEAAHDNLVEALSDDDMWIRLNAASTLSRVGPYGKDVVPMLIECLENDEDRMGKSAIVILADIGSEASDALPYIAEMTKLADTEPSLAMFAVYAIGYIGQDAGELEDHILPFLRSNHDGHTLAAVTALTQLRSKSPKFVDFLIEELADPDGRSQGYMQILGDIGPSAADAIPVIIEIIEDSKPHNWLRHQAIETLAKIGTGPEIVDILLHYADDYPLPVRCTAIRTLGKLRPTPDGLVDKFLDMLTKEPDREIRKALCIALGDIGPEAKAVVPILMEQVVPGHKWGRPATWPTEALGKIGPDAADATPVLIEALEYIYQYETRFSDSVYEEFLATAFALSDIGPGAKDALPKLYGLLDKDQYGWNPAIHYAIAGINGDAAGAVPHLVEIIGNDERVGWNYQLLQVITKLGPKASGVVDALVDKFWVFRKELHDELVDALGAIGPAAAPALDDLRILARTYPDVTIDRPNTLRGKALDAIAKIEGR